MPQIPTKNRLFSLVALMCVALTSMAGPAYAASSSVQISGAVKASDGKPLDGAVVSARRVGATFTTSVFADEQGKYVFPPLDGGAVYTVWAQAVGFESAKGVPSAQSGTARQDFTLNTYKDFGRQLSGAEWIASLPEDTPENRRMKGLFRNNCAGCHQPNFVLQNRFDQTGWTRIINVMERVGIYGDPPREDNAPLPLLRAYKNELAAYLAKVRGPEPTPFPLKPFPRPHGEAAQVVITEYDITSNANTDQFVTANGSNWMEGVPSAYEARGPHDAQVDANGFLWIADSQANSVRTVMRLDPKTGEVKNFKLPGRGELAKRSHGISIDRNGNAWFNADSGLGKIDTKTEKVEWFDPPRGMMRVGGTIDVDNQGIVWASADDGALRFDPATKQFTEYKSLSSGYEGRTYGIAVDADGNCWWAQMDYDKLGKSDIRSGKSLEVVLQPRPGWDENVTARDREIFKAAGADWNSAPLWAQGPRRLSADKKGNIVWVADWWGDNLAKIDIKTNKVLGYYQYPAGLGYAGVYSTVVDKNGMIWMNLMNADRVARFDPKTEKWTTIQLPSLGTETRFIAVDNRTDPVEVWTPYWRTSRIARIQFRTRQQLLAQN
jgi:streptogramin lyase